MLELSANKIHYGDVLKVLKRLPGECVDCIVTSPPYYGLRDYGVDGQIGLEKTLDEYLGKMLAITAELKRVLKKRGTMWWNHGDCYSAQRWTGNGQGQSINKFKDGHREINPPKGTGLDDKTLVLQNYRLASDMVYKQAWYLRNVIIWHKPSCMPSSVKDRFTVDYEPVFFFTKSKKYWFEMQHEPHTTDWKEGPMGAANRSWSASDSLNHRGSTAHSVKNPLGRNKRSVWKIATKPYKEAHFATFPPALIETPIKAGCPEFICKNCGTARQKIYERVKHELIKIYKGQVTKNHDFAKAQTPSDTKRRIIDAARTEHKHISYTDCGCKAGWERGIVLDPFMGSGTTALVAQSLNRKWIGIELNPEYIKISERRLAQAQNFLERLAI